MYPRRSTSALRACLALAVTWWAVGPVRANTIPNLGTAADFAVLGLDNAVIVNSKTTITGNEGVSQGGSLANNGTSAVTGNVVEYQSGQYSGPGTVGGSIVVSPSQMAQANTDAQSAYNTAVNDTPTQTFGAVNSSTTITGNGGLNVISISSINLSSTSTLTLTGTSSDIFVVLVSGNVSLSGTSGLVVGGGVTIEHVMYVFTGTGQSLSTGKSTTWDGTLLAPSPSTVFTQVDNTFQGEIITGSTASGGGGLTLSSGGSVTAHPFNGVPEPGSLLLAGIGATVFLARSARRVRKANARVG
jgi:hypothetical protein